MGMYSLVPKKKTKVLKQRTVLEMFKELQQTAKNPEVCVGNASEDEESEDVDSEEEEQQQPAEEPEGAAAQETSESITQVGYQKLFPSLEVMWGCFFEMQSH
uniref:Uncharacterized protein n=1 Tax=Amphilophus citrinellus TaxID=61819 RepID=A0A3Q0SSA0_AMPCI